MGMRAKRDDHPVHAHHDQCAEFQQPRRAHPPIPGPARGLARWLSAGFTVTLDGPPSPSTLSRRQSLRVLEASAPAPPDVPPGDRQIEEPVWRAWMQDPGGASVGCGNSLAYPWSSSRGWPESAKGRSAGSRRRRGLATPLLIHPEDQHRARAGAAKAGPCARQRRAAGGPEL